MLASPLSLTPREHEVLALVIQGLNSNAIASQLGVSIHTVRVHRAHLLDKLDARNTAQLVLRALELGVTTEREHPKPRPA